MNTAEVESSAWELLAEIAEEVPRYRGNLAAFAHSIDVIDHTGPEMLRRRACELAWLVALQTDEFVERTWFALLWACTGDAYAEKEIAGRFRSAVKRVRILDAISRHPRRHRFNILVRALERGRFTQEQWQLAQRLAREAPAAEA